jgi:NADP-dependent 3-hydroxy acid dehydrogenase YdfG
MGLTESISDWSWGMETIDGKVAFITGSGRGLGEAIARELGGAGVKLALVDIRADLLHTLAKNFSANGVEVLPLVVDLCDEQEIQSAIEQAAGHFGRIDVLINNAGIDKTEPIETLTVEDWDRVLAVNLRAPFVTMKHVFPIMRAQGGGHIVNIASTAAKRAWANASLYHASKWGLLGLSHSIHVEGRPHNIKVTAVLAGGMRTPFLLDRFPDIPLENLQDPANVAETVHFILTQPKETVIPEVMVIPMRETSWP